MDIKQHQKRLTYYCGIDIGTRNLGNCFYNFKTNEAILNLIDVQAYYDPITKKYQQLQYKESDLQTYCLNFINRYDHLFLKTRYVGIEKQMKRKYLGMEFILKAILDERYGAYGMTTFIISPSTTRVQYSISTKEYDTNKQISGDIMRNFVSQEQLNQCWKVFNKSDPQVHVDAFEAFLIAYLFKEKLQRILKIKEDQRKLKFDSISKKKQAVLKYERTIKIKLNDDLPKQKFKTKPLPVTIYTQKSIIQKLYKRSITYGKPSKKRKRTTKTTTKKKVKKTKKGKKKGFQSDFRFSYGKWRPRG